MPIIHVIIRGFVMDKIKILFLAANPFDTEPLDLDKEVDAITKELDRKGTKDKFVFVKKMDVKANNISLHFLEEKPDIVHFSGHGSKANEIYLLDTFGEKVPVGAKVVIVAFRINSSFL